MSNKVHTSAVVVIPPEEQWQKIQEIRRKHDKAFFRWMPHINLLYPFVPDSEFGGAVERFRGVLRDAAPFTVSFNTFDFFEHGRRSCTMYLKPEPPNALIKLQKDLESVFPDCNDLSTLSADGFHPHLTVGQFNGQPATLKKKTEFLDPKGSIAWKPITFTVDKVHLISRTGIKPFEIVESVSLTGSSQSVPPVVIDPAASYWGQTPSVWGVPSPTTTNTTTQTASVGDAAKGQPSLSSNAEKKETKPKKPKPVRESVDIAAKRIKKWIKTQKKAHKLPKSKEKLLAAIKPLCNVRYSSISADQVIEKLKVEGYVEITAENKVVYKQKGTVVSSPPSFYDNESSEEDTLIRCRKWVMHPLNSPKTMSSLKNSLECLCIRNKLVDPAQALQKLEDQHSISIDTDNRVTYNLV